MRLAVVGNRTGWEEASVINKLSMLMGKDDEIVSGGAEGVDTYAQKFAKMRGLKITIFYPDPYEPSPQRYYERNQKIVDSADKLIAFQKKSHKSGTQSTINRAEKKGIPVIIVKGSEECQRWWEKEGYTNVSCSFHPINNCGERCEPKGFGACAECVHNWKD